ncbi:hypothetical protein ABD76_13795 [Paenibacillus dendritiformis]|nr:hypothetical protein [Paenibacillus dendritiformis]
MIVWKGLGVLNIVVPGTLLFIVNILLSPLGHNSVDSRLPLAFVFIVSGVIIWYMGKALNSKSGKVLVDADTGERYQTGTEHSLFIAY